MRLIDADELIEHAAREKLDSRELIIQMIERAPTVGDDLKQRVRDLSDVNNNLYIDLENEREFSRNIVRMVVNFQEGGKENGRRT